MASEHARDAHNHENTPGVGADQTGIGRRGLLSGGCTAGAFMVLAGCSNPSASAPRTGVLSSRPPAAETPQFEPRPPVVLAAATDIPVGGGSVFPMQRVVVTQPRTGQFAAFSAVCTHEGCIVYQVSNGTIDCPCHGSRFSITDGSVVHGPARRPLPRRSISLDGAQILLNRRP